MPTASKLVAALMLAALAYVVSDIVKSQMPPNTAFGSFTWINVLIGFVCGWTVVGSRAGRGMAAGIANGLTGVVSAVFWALLVQAVNEMVKLSMRHRYDGMVEAMAGVFELAIRFGENLLNVPILTTLLLGALATGYLTEITSRHWR